MSKPSLRKKFLSLRQQAHEHATPATWRRMQENLWSYPPFASASTVMLYSSKETEAPTHDLLQRALSEGKKVALPITHAKDRVIELSIITSLEDLVPSSFGILEPKLSLLRPCDPKDIDFALVPGISFDKEGNRLGWGLGFYDRFLPRLSCPTAGFCYEVQVADKLPREKFDVPVKGLITETASRAIVNIHLQK